VNRLRHQVRKDRSAVFPGIAAGGHKPGIHRVQPVAPGKIREVDIIILHWTIGLSECGPNMPGQDRVLIVIQKSGIFFLYRLVDQRLNQAFGFAGTSPAGDEDPTERVRDVNRVSICQGQGKGPGGRSSGVLRVSLD